MKERKKSTVLIDNQKDKQATYNLRKKFNYLESKRQIILKEYNASKSGLQLTQNYI